MRIIYAFIRTAFHNAYIYRLDFWGRQFALLIMMYAMYSLWRVLYTQTPHAFGMDLQSMTTYGILGMLLMPMMEGAASAQRYIAEQVRLGTLELDLMKPLNYIFHMFSRCVGDLGVYLLTHIIPAFIFALLFLEFSLPVSLTAGLAFVISLALGFLVYFFINMLMGMLSITTLDIRSYNWAFWSLVRFASGQVVPLWMYPPFLGAIVVMLPFKDIYFTPMAIYVGAYEGDYIQPILSQGIWAVVLFLLVQFFWARVQRRIVIQGG
jgi:ABC-2 type transport system permease protein